MAVDAAHWFQPDSRWPLLGFATREAYVSGMVPAVDFHAGVHSDVREAYETVAHLLALAWYHYPLYDEALRKLTGMVEMAVKLRCQQVGVALVTGSVAGHPVPLASLIDRLCQGPSKAALRARLHQARLLRNHQAHPEHHSYGGIAFSRAIVPLVELLNDLFPT